MEQLNIEGKRSGDGFVAHKAVLLEALQRTTADRIILCGVEVGRKGLLNYFKALAGNNIIKVVPAKGSVNAQKSLKVVCGSHIGNLASGEWVNENTPPTSGDLRVSPTVGIKPNIGASEMATALSRVIPFSAKLVKDDKRRPVLGCVLMEAKGGVLTLVGADGIGMAINTLSFDEQEAKALVPRDDLRAIVNALRRAKRLNVVFEGKGEESYSQVVVFMTDLVQYRLESANYRFPDYRKQVPTSHTAVAHIDTVETAKAINALKAINAIKDYAVDLLIEDNRLVLASPDDKETTVGEHSIPCETEGSIDIRLVGSYLSNALRLCGGMVDISATKPYENLMVKQNGYTVLLMPQLSNKAKTAYEADQKAKEADKPVEPKAVKPVEPKGKKVAEPKAKQAIVPVSEHPTEPTEPTKSQEPQAVGSKA